MEDKLRALVTKIETSPLSESDKTALYIMIQEGLQVSVLPVLLKYMNKEDLKDLSDNPANISVDRYVKLIADSLKNPASLPEMSQAMEGLLSEAEKGLAEAGIN